MAKRGRKPKERADGTGRQVAAALYRCKDFDPSKIGLVYNFCLLGLTDVQIAAALGISTCTLREWQKAIPSFRQAFEEGRDIADGNVAASLYKRATGYSYIKKTPVKLKQRVIDETGKITAEREVIEYQEETVHIPPDVKACQLWLQCRRRVKDGNFWSPVNATEALAVADTTLAVNINFIPPGGELITILDSKPKEEIEG